MRFKFNPRSKIKVTLTILLLLGISIAGLNQKFNFLAAVIQKNPTSAPISTSSASVDHTFLSRYLIDGRFVAQAVTKPDDNVVVGGDVDIDAFLNPFFYGS